MENCAVIHVMEGVRNELEERKRERKREREGKRERVSDIQKDRQVVELTDDEDCAIQISSLNKHTVMQSTGKHTDTW